MIAKLSLTALAVSLLAGAARAETLADAIAAAYQSNPTLQGDRAQQRILDESDVQARAGYRPTASVTGTVGYTREDFGNEVNGGIVSNGQNGFVSGVSSVDYNSSGVQLSLTQPIYNGGRTATAVQAADASILAGRQGLKASEQSVLQSVIQAYEDVRRDQEIVDIRNRNLEVLSHQLDETNAKFTAGQVTRTDTAQAAAQLAASRSLLTSAQSQLQISRAAFTAVVGHNPGSLDPAPPLPGLPPTVDVAFDAAEAENPILLRAVITEQSSRAKIAEARAANRPTVALQGTLGYSGQIAPFDTRNFDRAITASATVTQPLFTGGVNASNIRLAVEQNNADRIAIEAARRQVVQGVSTAWNTMVASRANTVSDEDQVNSAGVAFEGEQAEYRAGLRTTLDVLISQENLRDAQLALVQARHDEYVAEAGLLSAVGRLDAARLVSGVPLYDPKRNLDRVRRIGSVPWEGAVAALDTLGAPKPGGPVAIPTPRLAGPVAMTPADAPIPARAPFSTTQPTAEPH